MNKIMISILCLALSSMACLSTAADSSLDAAAPVVAERTLTNTPAPGATDRATSAPTLAPIERCAVVVADEALHLRGAASESAFVLTWLKRGDVVQVVSNSDPNWSEVLFGKYQGFARSIYLEESECEK